MSAIDPVESIKEQTYDHPVISDLDETLRRLAELPPSNTTPYLTAVLDWTPHGGSPALRPAAIEASNAVQAIIAEQEKRSAAMESLTADVEAITVALRRELDSAARGVYVVANSARNVFELEPLGVPVETFVQAGPIPMLKRLAQLVEDYPLHVLLQADQDTAVLSFITEDLISGEIHLRSSLYPRKQAAGGWSQRRYQARADERVQAFAKAIAEETRKALDETGARRLVLATSAVMEPELLEAFHPTVAEKIIGSFNMGVDVPFNDVLDRFRPIAIEFERKREAEQIAQLQDALPHGNAVAGTVDVLNALRNGQVYRVLMTRQFAEKGWIDPEMRLFGIGDPPAEHPAGGDMNNILVVPLEEEIIRQAVQAGAQIEVVKGTPPIDPEAGIPDAGEGPPRKEAVQPLDELGGVAAMLRFTI